MYSAQQYQLPLILAVLLLAAVLGLAGYLLSPAPDLGLYQALVGFCLLCLMEAVVLQSMLRVSWPRVLLSIGFGNVLSLTFGLFAIWCGRLLVGQVWPPAAAALAWPAWLFLCWRIDYDVAERALRLTAIPRERIRTAVLAANMISTVLLFAGGLVLDLTSWPLPVAP
ncbi:MAG: hypothetical protein D6E12_15895 [Desulfovibrio sp.]|nr:MAG: hypothetical protein D6E12_15895 [Desulfovibrio sp.]